MVFRSVIALAACVIGGPSVAWAVDFSVLYEFVNGYDGGNCHNSLMMGSDGTLYSENGWNVFALRPPSSATDPWTEQHVGSINGDGLTQNRLLLNADGKIFVTETYGGAVGYGQVSSFERSSPNSWKKGVIYTFERQIDGSGLSSGVVRGPDGALYGVTELGGWKNRGTIYRLLPPTKSRPQWTKETLYGFRGGTDGSTPQGELAITADRTLYGVTSDSTEPTVGTVFSLTPPVAPATKWTKKVLHRFKNSWDGAYPNGVKLDSNGDLVGTAASGGTYSFGVVFKLSRPTDGSQTWKFSVLHAFGDYRYGEMPESNIIFGRGGVIYGTTSGGGLADAGLVYALTPPGTTGDRWNFRVLHAFAGGDGGASPIGSVLLRDHALYGIAADGATNGRGLVYRIGL